MEPYGVWCLWHGVHRNIGNLFTFLAKRDSSVWPQHGLLTLVPAVEHGVASSLGLLRSGAAMVYRSMSSKQVPPSSSWAEPAFADVEVS